jgi:hypothetical protein
MPIPLLFVLRLLLIAIVTVGVAVGFFAGFWISAGGMSWRRYSRQRRLAI